MAAENRNAPDDFDAWMSKMDGKRAWMERMAEEQMKEFRRRQKLHQNFYTH
jgi:hypothetical protein